MEDLAGKLFGKFKHEAVKLKREAKRVAELETVLEKNIREATSNENWNCANSVLYDLAQSSTNFAERRKIMDKIWEKLQSSPERWRRILKTLTLLEFLMKNGSEQVVGELNSEQNKVRQLTSFRFSEQGKERGASVCEKAKFVIELMGDRDLLRAERDKAKEHKNKLQGIATGDGNGGYGSSGATRFESQSLSKANFEDRFNELKKKKTELQRDPFDRPSRDAHAHGDSHHRDDDNQGRAGQDERDHHDERHRRDADCEDRGRRDDYDDRRRREGSNDRGRRDFDDNGRESRGDDRSLSPRDSRPVADGYGLWDNGDTSPRGSESGQAHQQSGPADLLDFGGAEPRVTAVASRTGAAEDWCPFDSAPVAASAPPSDDWGAFASSQAPPSGIIGMEDDLIGAPTQQAICTERAQGLDLFGDAVFQSVGSPAPITMAPCMPTQFVASAPSFPPQFSGQQPVVSAPLFGQQPVALLPGLGAPMGLQTASGVGCGQIACTSSAASVSVGQVSPAAVPSLLSQPSSGLPSSSILDGIPSALCELKLESKAPKSGYGGGPNGGGVFGTVESGLDARGTSGAASAKSGSTTVDVGDPFNFAS